jgi:predicted DsbA family dithiol-disulfide isomerase
MPSIVAPVQVEIFSDVVCPWCYIGKTRFDEALRRLDNDGISVTYSPYQLDPTAPLDRTTPVLEAYAKKFGGPEKARAIIDHVSATAAQDGLIFAMDRALRANTRLAHRLLLAAGDTANADAQQVLYGMLFRGYFSEGADIANRETLRAYAAHAGLEEATIAAALDGDHYDAMLAEGLQRAAALGITAVPTFVIDERWSIPGAQDVEFFERTLARLLDNR